MSWPPSRSPAARLEPAALRSAVLPRLRRAIPIDALWWATVGPGHLALHARHTAKGSQPRGRLFLDKESLSEDVNKSTELRAPPSHPTRSHAARKATENEPTRSARYRDVFEPLGLPDELRGVPPDARADLGDVCLHRERVVRVLACGAQRFHAPHRPAPRRRDQARAADPERGRRRSRRLAGLILLAPTTPSWLRRRGCGSVALDEAADSRATRSRSRSPQSQPGSEASLRRHALRCCVRDQDAPLGDASAPMEISGREHAAVAVIIQEATPEELRLSS